MNILEKVAAKIDGSKTHIVNAVVDRLAEVELNKRITLIQESVSRLDSLEKELRKLDRADNITYIGGVKTESYSKVKYEEVQKSKEKITNLRNSLDKALEENTQETYTKLQEVYAKSNLNNAGGNQKQGSGKAEPESQSTTS